MKKIIKPRNGGKTTELIKESAETGFYIICKGLAEASGIVEEAYRLKLNIPFPLTYNEFLSRQYYSKGVKGFLIDNVDLLIEEISGGVKVGAITLTEETKEFDLTLKEVIDNVREFHDAFGVKNNEIPTSDLSTPDVKLRHKLMFEENQEYLEAALDEDLIEIADALGDMLYILSGTILKHGLQDKIGEIFKEIHRSNMSKLDKDGNPIYREDGKVLKGENYFKPNFSRFIDILKT